MRKQAEASAFAWIIQLLVHAISSAVVNIKGNGSLAQKTIAPYGDPQDYVGEKATWHTFNLLLWERSLNAMDITFQEKPDLWWLLKRSIMGLRDFGAILFWYVFISYSFKKSFIYIYI